MEISSKMYDSFLTPNVMQKFRIAISQNLESQTWDLKEILSEFHKEFRLREQCLETLRTSDRQTRFREVRCFILLRLCTLKALTTNSFLVCGARFPIKIIRTLNVMWSNAESSKQVLRKKGRCYLCLRSGHLSRNCKSPVKCFKCQGAHHVATCDSFE